MLKVINAWHGGYMYAGNVNSIRDCSLELAPTSISDHVHCPHYYIILKCDTSFDLQNKANTTLTFWKWFLVPTNYSTFLRNFLGQCWSAQTRACQDPFGQISIKFQLCSSAWACFLALFILPGLTLLESLTWNEEIHFNIG